MKEFDKQIKEDKKPIIKDKPPVLVTCVYCKKTHEEKQISINDKVIKSLLTELNLTDEEIVTSPIF